MASGSTTSLQIDGKTMETVTDFIILGSKITANGRLKRLSKYSISLPKTAEMLKPINMKKRKARVIRKVSSCGKRKYNLGRGKRRNQKKKAMIRNVWRFCYFVNEKTT